MKDSIYKNNNYSLNYIYNESNSDTTLFLIHGYTMSSERWNLFFKKFSNLKIYAIDLPGHNKSSKLDEYSLPIFKNIIEDFFEKYKNKRNYIIGHSLGALLAFELAQTVENELQGVFLEEPGWLDEFPDIKDFGPNPFIIQNKSKWKTPIDAINNYKELDPEGFDENPYKASLTALRFYINDIKISTNFDFKPQNYQNIAKSLSIKIYVARANLEKGGMIPEQSKSKALESNKSIVFKEFDTGHNIMGESTDEYFEFVSEFLNHR